MRDDMPLTGIRVLDLTRIISGPFCSALLADMGAEVIKIEAPGEGDPVRKQGELHEGFSWYFANYNRNKLSVTLDLYSDEGKALLAALVRKSDVVVENFRPGVMEKLGLSPEALKALRPDIVHCGINGFGTSGPYRDRPAFDFIAQAMSGFMSVNGEADGPPLRAGPPVSDLVAGLHAALGIVAALLRRERSGQGESLSVSLLSSMINLLSFQASNYFASGTAPLRNGNDHALVAPYGLFETADGQVAIAPSNDTMYVRLLNALEMPALQAHPDFATNALRMRNRPALREVIQARTRQRETAYWIEQCNRHGVPCGPVLSVPEVFEDPQVRDQQMAIDVEHPGHGPVRMLGFPIKFSQAPCRLRHPAPALGGDTAAVLAGIGVGAAELERLREEGIV